MWAFCYFRSVEKLNFYLLLEPKGSGEGTRGAVACKISWHERAGYISSVAEKTGTEGSNHC